MSKFDRVLTEMAGYKTQKNKRPLNVSPDVSDVSPVNLSNIHKFRSLMKTNVKEAAHFLKHEISIEDIAYILGKFEFDYYGEED